MVIIVLAGGEGTRLRSVLSDRPKPMAPINGHPFLEYLLAWLVRFNVSRFIICVSHLRSVIIDYFGSSWRGIPISYSIEETPLGTGGAIRKAMMDYDLREACIVNGDTYAAVDYNAFERLASGKQFAMVINKVDDVSRYGKVEINENYITQIREKQPTKEEGYINAGIYWIGDQLVQHMPLNGSFENDFLVPRLPELQPRYLINDGYFIDIGIPESYRVACDCFMKLDDNLLITKS